MGGYDQAGPFDFHQPHRERGSYNYANRANFSRWTQPEHNLFVTLLKRYGRDWKKIEEFMNGTKSDQQCRTRGIIMLQKLRENCWDPELYQVLRSKINPGYSSSRYAVSKTGQKDDRKPVGSEEVESLDMRKEIESQLKIF